MVPHAGVCSWKSSLRTPNSLRQGIYLLDFRKLYWPLKYSECSSSHYIIESVQVWFTVPIKSGCQQVVDWIVIYAYILTVVSIRVGTMWNSSKTAPVPLCHTRVCVVRICEYWNSVISRWINEQIKNLKKHVQYELNDVDQRLYIRVQSRHCFWKVHYLMGMHFRQEHHNYTSTVCNIDFRCSQKYVLIFRRSLILKRHDVSAVDARWIH